MSQPALRSLARTVILLDTRVLDASNFHQSVKAIGDFIEESLGARHLVMIAEIDRGLEMVTPFTRDRNELLRAVRSLKPGTVYNPLDRGRMLSNFGEQYFEDLQKQVAYLRTGLKLLCYSLSAMPGRKHVVFFSEGYPLNPNRELEMATGQHTMFGSADQRQAASRDAGSRKDPGVLQMINEIVSVANGFGITFYAVDARGLEAVAGIGRSDFAGDVAAGPGESMETRVEGAASGASESTPTEIALATFQLTSIGNIDEAQNTLVALSAGTNGSAFFNTNDLGSVLRASTSEQHHTYLASFVPKGRKGRFNRVKVSTSRKGVMIRSQVGYLDLPQTELANARRVMAFQNPAFFKHLTPVIQVEPSADKSRVVMGVPGAQVAYRQNGDQFRFEVLLIGQVFDATGKPISETYPITRGFRLDLASEQVQSLAGQPLLAQQELELPRGKYRLVLAVEDNVAGTLGVGEREFVVP